MTTSARIAVVGAGVIGAASALLLSRAGAEVVVLERQPPAPDAGGAALGEDLRTLALSPASLALIEGLDAWDEGCRAAACSYQAMEVWDAEGTGRIRFEATEADVPELGRIVPNRPLVQALWHALQREGIECLAGRSVEALARDGDRSVLVLDDGATLEAELVVAADGAASRVRELAGIEVDAEDMAQRAVATLAEVAAPHGNTAWQCFMPSGPLAFLPLPDQDGRHRVSVVWSLDVARAAEVEALDDAAFAVALAEAFEHRLGPVLAVDRRVGFPLRQLHARRYRAPGVVLVGDAAHVLHPLAGQGVNIGLADARLLVRELAPSLRGALRLPLTDPDLLYHYERRRRGENAIMLRAMSGLQRLFAARTPELRWLRNEGLRQVDGLPAVKREFMRRALGLVDASSNGEAA